MSDSIKTQPCRTPRSLTRRFTLRARNVWLAEPPLGLSRRIVVWLVVAGALLAFSAGTAWAQDSSWPPYPLPNSPTEFKQVRGPGGYFSLFKIGLFLVPFFLWVKTTDWANRDCQQLRLNYGKWNPIVFAPFFVAIIVTWVLPWFWLGYLLMWGAYGGSLVAYVLERNKHVDDDQKMLTADHFRRVVSAAAGKVGLKVDLEKKAPHQQGPPITFVAQGGANEQANQAQLILARQSAGLLPAKELIDQALKLHAEQIMLEYTAASVGVKFQIDGVWHAHKPLERVQGDPALEVFKLLANLKPADRVTKQVGKFGVEAHGQKYNCRLQSQGTSAGEAALVAFEQKKLSFHSLDELGMRGKMQEQLKEIVGGKSGFVVVSAMPGGGLTTTFDVLLSSTDRFMRNFVAVEDRHKPEREIENIAVTHFDSKAGQMPMDVLPRLIRTYPDVFVVRDLVNGETLDTLCDQVVQEERLVFATIRAKEATEALLRVLMLKPNPEKFAKAITAVLNVRLVRKLCDHCKEAYPPPPEVLKQLGLPPGKVQAFFRPPVPPPPESEAAKQYKPCEECMAIGYRGRTAIFELLTVNDAMRQILVNSPKLDLLREAAKKAGNRNLQEEGVLLLVKGITSVPELIRVLKQ